MQNGFAYRTDLESPNIAFTLLYTSFRSLFTMKKSSINQLSLLLSQRFQLRFYFIFSGLSIIPLFFFSMRKSYSLHQFSSSYTKHFGCMILQHQSSSSVQMFLNVIYCNYTCRHNSRNSRHILIVNFSNYIEKNEDLKYQ